MPCAFLTACKQMNKMPWTRLPFMKATDVLRVNVKDAVDASERSIEALGMEISDFNKGNIKARERWSLNMRLPAKRVVP